MNREPPPLRAKLIHAQDTYPLRQMVLRPTLTIDQVAMEGDASTDTFHVGVIQDGSPDLLAIMTVMHDPSPVDQRDAWRIRGMASHPDSRGTGCGKIALLAGVEEAIKRTPRPIWCNARRIAYGFYEHFGFKRFGAEFDIEGVGPHTVMVREHE